ncbi:O-antigen ligase family protein [Alphaproteobacteria bacterium]|nr:O-antigen ligase family protein [Alphaproteobacteria bacterium]
MLAPPVYDFYLTGSDTFGREAKGLFGSQRYGFMYLMAFWIVYFYFESKTSLNFYIKYIILFLLVSGIFITFSRSSVLSLLVSLILFIFHEILFGKKKIKNIAYFSVLTLTIYLLIYFKANYLIQFFDQTFFSIIFNQGVDGFDFSNPEGSEGYRLYMFQKIISYVSINPFTGSGYLGVWILFSELAGSAHNQYLDVLFRTGILGFIIYMCLITKVVTYLYNVDKGLFFGFLAVLVYGLFHETFKLSQGGFLLSFLLAVAFQKKSVDNLINKVGRID